MKLKLKNEKDMIIVIEKKKKNWKRNSETNFVEHSYCSIISQSYY